MTASPRFWIQSLVPDDDEGWLEFDAEQFDSDWGYGEKAGRVYEGEVLCLQGDESRRVRVHMAYVHAIRRGFYKVLQAESPELLPEPPFFLTGDLQTVRLFQGEVKWIPEGDWVDEQEAMEVGDVIAVAADHWLGVLEKVSADPARWLLQVFGTPGTASASPGQALMAPVFRECIGTLAEV